MSNDHIQSREFLQLDNRVSTLDSKVSTLDSKVSTLDKRVSTLDSKVSTLDNRMSTLVRESREAQAKMDTRFDLLAKDLVIKLSSVIVGAVTVATLISAWLFDYKFEFTNEQNNARLSRLEAGLILSNPEVWTLVNKIKASAENKRDLPENKPNQNKKLKPKPKK